MSLELGSFRLAPGTYTCFNCKASKISLPGVCQACADVFKVREFNAALQPAVDSVPTKYAWTGDMVGNAERQASFKASATRFIHDAATIIAKLREARMAILAGEVSTVVFYGPESFKGKTSSACALLRRFIEDGRWRALSDADKAIARSHDVSVPRFAAPEHKALALRIARARGARFVEATELQLPSGIVRDDVQQRVYRACEIAETAPILVLDDLGQELRGMHPSATNRPDLRGTQDVIHRRSNRPELITIITTWLKRSEVAEYFGANIQTRVFQNSFVIPVGPNASLEDVR